MTVLEATGQKLSEQYQTPPHVARYMASMIPNGTRTIMEPCCGSGNLVATLSQYNVTAPDDFFLTDMGARYDCIIMNPPFSGKSAVLDNAPPYLKVDGMKVGYWILQRCMDMSDNVIALMPWFTLLDSDVRLKEIQNYGLISVTALPRKTFNYARVQTCILQLRKGYRGFTDFLTYKQMN